MDQRHLYMGVSGHTLARRAPGCGWAADEAHSCGVRTQQRRAGDGLTLCVRATALPAPPCLLPTPCPACSLSMVVFCGRIRDLFWQRPQTRKVRFYGAAALPAVSNPCCVVASAASAVLAACASSMRGGRTSMRSAQPPCCAGGQRSS